MEGVKCIVERAVCDGVVLMVVETECYYPKPCVYLNDDGMPGLEWYDTELSADSDTRTVWFQDYPGWDVWSAAGVKGGIHVTLILGGE